MRGVLKVYLLFCMYIIYGVMRSFGVPGGPCLLWPFTLEPLEFASGEPDERSLLDKLYHRIVSSIAGYSHAVVFVDQKVFTARYRSHMVVVAVR